MRWNWSLQILLGTVVSCLGFAHMPLMAETMPPITFLAIALIGLVQIALGVLHFWKADEADPALRIALGRSLLTARKVLEPAPICMAARGLDYQSGVDALQCLQNNAEEIAPELRAERLAEERLTVRPHPRIHQPVG